jgi:hypothetical protein
MAVMVLHTRMNHLDRLCHDQLLLVLLSLPLVPLLGICCGLLLLLL